MTNTYTKTFLKIIATKHFSAIGIFLFSTFIMIGMDLPTQQSLTDINLSPSTKASRIELKGKMILLPHDPTINLIGYADKKFRKKVNLLLGCKNFKHHDLCIPVQIIIPDTENPKTSFNWSATKMPPCMSAALLNTLDTQAHNKKKQIKKISDEPFPTLVIPIHMLIGRSVIHMPNAFKKLCYLQLTFDEHYALEQEINQIHSFPPLSFTYISKETIAPLKNYFDQINNSDAELSNDEPESSDEPPFELIGIDPSSNFFTRANENFLMLPKATEDHIQEIITERQNEIDAIPDTEENQLMIQELREAPLFDMTGLVQPVFLLGENGVACQSNLFVHSPEIGETNTRNSLLKTIHCSSDQKNIVKFLENNKSGVKK